ncbi:hypothetical protein BRADI_4g10373v3 [Brachypodium distachyon]|uniref:Uncharacterized protein n=1 Tax=Brachypodium distachyon TaxID=15368 RepID=A0A2K2CLU2_BRADI|nr:hypothetical protein BRADI_4g10373v3 [Brachypodium distachyon]
MSFLSQHTTYTCHSYKRHIMHIYTCTPTQATNICKLYWLHLTWTCAVLFMWHALAHYRSTSLTINVDNLDEINGINKKTT